MSVDNQGRRPGLLVRILRRYLIAAGAASTLLFLWLISPLGITAPLVENDPPMRSAAIVCLDSGTDHGLPSSSGWQRIRTSVLLFHDGYAPMVIFSGTTGKNGRNVTQIYAEAAGWIGLPETAAKFEPRSRSTIEQAHRLLETPDVSGLGKSSPLLIVTSPYHGRRVGLVFRKAGFTRIRVVTSYGLSEEPSDQETQGFVVRLLSRISEAMVSAREWAALAYYKARGWI